MRTRRAFHPDLSVKQADHCLRSGDIRRRIVDDREGMGEQLDSGRPLVGILSLLGEIGQHQPKRRRGPLALLIRG